MLLAIFAAAATAATAPSPALGSTVAPAPAAATAPAPGGADPKAPPAAAPKMKCSYETSVGTLLAKKVCRIDDPVEQARVQERVRAMQRLGPAREK